MADSVADNAALRALWDTEKNEKDTASVLARSTRAVWWKCGDGHSFQKAPRMMARDASCPTCAMGGASLSEKRPSIMKFFHAEKNVQSADSVSSTSTAKVWWKCSEGHAFERAPISMIHDSSCPHCALSVDSLAAKYPQIAAEWHPKKNGELGPDHVEPGHMMTVWWVCAKGHEFQASVRSRTKSEGRCPVCYGNWSVSKIRDFVQSLLEHIEHFDPGEMIALAMQAGALRDKASQAFVKALSSGRFPTSELEKFAEGKPSLVDDFAANAEFTLELQETAEKQRLSKPDDPFALPAAPDDIYDDGPADIDVSSEIGESQAIAAAEEGELPVVETRDALAALDSSLIANADAETVKFLLDSAEAKLWKHAYKDPALAKKQAEEFEGDTYSTLVRDRFLATFRAAEELKLPRGYAFRPKPGAPIAEPNLMQKRVVVAVQDKKRFGNWSGMGAGKTLSAILATRVVDAGLTIICCPNAVVSNWEKEINNAFSGCQIASKTWTPEWPDPMSNKPRYLIMNFEQFQQQDSESRLVTFLDHNIVDFVVIDEIHFAKQRNEGLENASQRKRLVQALILEAGKKNADLHVLGMSGTPVINVLQEGKSLVEMITGHRHDDLETKATVQNCMRLYQRLVTLGTRWKPNYRAQLVTNKPEIDCGDYLDEIRAIAKGTVLEMEQVLTKIRLPVILENIEPGTKTLIYTHYVSGIDKLLWDAVKGAGHRPGLFTGKVDDADLIEFKKKDGNVDVLIASSRVSTGVDGLQHVCNKLIINSLPWTNAEYEQLRARVWRQGGGFDQVTVVIPVTYAMVNGERWSYCESKLQRLEYKKSIADAAVDGVVPEGNLRTPSQAQGDIMEWLKRLEEGQLEMIERKQIEIPLSRSPGDVERRVRHYGDFSKMNNRWYASNSNKTHERLQRNSEEWAHYHTMYQELRESWPVVPFEEEVKWLEKRQGLEVGDFGCGEALIAAAVKDKHNVYSFDHVAINDDAVACDIAATSLEDEVLDVAIFCLSLMGANFTDYIREAHRCLKLDRSLHIWEPASYFPDPDLFCRKLERLGFDAILPKKEGVFMRIYANKTATKPDPNLVLPFRGHGL